MKIIRVLGKDRGKVVLYALSTCAWCKKVKDLLDRLGIGYSYVYVDLEKGQSREEAVGQVKRFNPACSFPTLVMDDDRCIVGYREKEIMEAIG
ncbi:MAG: glutaredoxin family protein [Methanotrichaceae archaeon]|nr:glutaredoxin family protein [Methanotrichaceae archaeon]